MAREALNLPTRAGLSRFWSLAAEGDQACRLRHISICYKFMRQIVNNILMDWATVRRRTRICPAKRQRALRQPEEVYLLCVVAAAARSPSRECRSRCRFFVQVLICAAQH